MGSADLATLQSELSVTEAALWSLREEPSTGTGRATSGGSGTLLLCPGQAGDAGDGADGTSSAGTTGFDPREPSGGKKGQAARPTASGLGTFDGHTGVGEAVAQPIGRVTV